MPIRASFVLQQGRVLVSVKSFAGSQIGMGNESDNITFFRQCLTKYFPGIGGIFMLKLRFQPDYSAIIIAKNSNFELEENMSIDKANLQRMLSGISSDLDNIDLRWEMIEVTIQHTGMVTVDIIW